MKMAQLNCPNCGATLTFEDGIDILYCSHCGTKVVIEDLSKEIIEAKVKFKQFEHEERMLDKTQKFKRSENRHHSIGQVIKTIIIAIVIMICFYFFMIVVGGLTFIKMLLDA